MGASRITGPGLDNIPISGFPQDAKLTSIDWKYKKNPLFYSFFSNPLKYSSSFFYQGEKIWKKIFSVLFTFYFPPLSHISSSPL